MLYPEHQYHIDNVIKIVKFERKYDCKKMWMRYSYFASFSENSALLDFKRYDFDLRQLIVADCSFHEKVTVVNKFQMVISVSSRFMDADESAFDAKIT